MPFLFVAGVAFAYFVVMPAAISFLLNFNETEFNIEVRAKEYYGFLGIMVVVLGLLFQMPIALLSLCRLGVVTPGPARARTAATRSSRSRSSPRRSRAATRRA